MGGGIATADLAAAVSNGGGLGTVGMLSPAKFGRELSRARELAPGRPIAANLLVPFLRRTHVDACIESDVTAVVLYAGFASRVVQRLAAAGILVMQQVGTIGQARHAIATGVQALIVQGREAGGHLVGVDPTLIALQRALRIAEGRWVLAAGGVAGPEDVRRLLDGGADAVVAGTRFLVTEASAAHPVYKERVISAKRTIETKLFGFGWPMRHRVVPNAATERWCRRDPLGPVAVRAVNAATSGLGRVTPMEAGDTLLMRQRPMIPFFTPAPPLAGHPDRMVDASALYAGDSALRIQSIVPAGDAVRELAAGWA